MHFWLLRDALASHPGLADDYGRRRRGVWNDNYCHRKFWPGRVVIPLTVSAKDRVTHGLKAEDMPAAEAAIAILCSSLWPQVWLVDACGWPPKGWESGGSQPAERSNSAKTSAPGAV